MHLSLVRWKQWSGLQVAVLMTGCLKSRGDGWKVAVGGRIADATSPTTLSRKF